MYPTTSRWLIGATAALALTAAGCNRDQQADAERTGDRAAAEAQQAGREAGNDLNDGWITTKVQAKYFVTPDAKGRAIDVTTNNRVVTLTGTVETEQARQLAVQIARDTDGVARVDDRLVVGPEARQQARAQARDATAGAPAESRTAEPGESERPVGTGGSATDQPNAWVTTKIHAKYFTDGLVKGRNIDVDTNNGVVTLTGHVESEAERQQAVRIAQDTEGVRRVEDHLRVTLKAAEGSGSVPVGDTTHDARDASPDLGERTSDAGITARVQSKFFLDDAVKARNIDVDTLQGVVTLSGDVQTEAEHQQALAIARSVNGVRDVTDKLRVSSSPSGTSPAGTASSAAGAIDDTWVTTKIQSKFFLDDLVKGRRVDVTTQSGVVTLSGEVQSNEAKQRAEALARQTEGVTKVQNQLTVNAAAGNLPPVSQSEPPPAQQ
jgi:osmotically-inducible protein OsmY